MPHAPAELELSWADLRRWKEEGRPYLLVDVREAWERERSHIGGIWVPLGEITQRTIELGVSAPLVVYCRKGVRSLIAVQRLQARFPGRLMRSLAGGMEALPEETLEPGYFLSGYHGD
jgi:adenylyltransferase/sulfurtransferase